MARFEYSQARTLRHAVSLLARYGEGTQVVAGTTDFFVRWRQGFWNPSRVVSIKRTAGLDRLSYSSRAGLRMGPLVTIRTLETHPIIRRHYPCLTAAATAFARLQIRNLATVGGNVCNASPAGDTLPSLLALEARCRIVGPDGQRWLPIEEFFVGPGRSALKAGEVLAELRVPPSAPNTGSIYIKDSPRSAMDIASVGVTSVVSLDHGLRVFRNVSIALGAVAPTPMHARTAEATLAGRPVGQGLIDEAAHAAAEEARPIDDIRGSARHRRAIVEALTRRTIQYAVEMAQNEDTPFETLRSLSVEGTFRGNGIQVPVQSDSDELSF